MRGRHIFERDRSLVGGALHGLSARPRLRHWLDCADAVCTWQLCGGGCACHVRACARGHLSVITGCISLQRLHARLLLSAGCFGAARLLCRHLQQRYGPWERRSMHGLHPRPCVLDWLASACAMRTRQPRANDEERHVRAVPSILIPKRDWRIVVCCVFDGLLLPSRQFACAAANVCAWNIWQRVGCDWHARLF